MRNNRCKLSTERRIREWVLACCYTLLLTFFQCQEVVLIAMASTIFKYFTLTALDIKVIAHVDCFAWTFIYFHGTD